MILITYLDFSIGYKEEEHVKSGMRQNCQVYIEINAIQAYYNKIPFFISRNNVVLTPGIEETLPIQYFKVVKDFKNNVLFAQDYSYGLFFDLADLNNGYVPKKVQVWNLREAVLLFEFEDFENFANLIKTLVNKDIFKEPVTILVEKKNEQAWVNYIKNSVKIVQDFIGLLDHYNLIPEGDLQEYLKYYYL